MAGSWRIEREGYPLPTDTLNYAKGYREREERERKN
jgi:hypothetical protein